jgi:hypothetical protein
MADAYGLTRDMADAIVKAVRDDAPCRLLLPRWSAFKVFGGIGHAGTARNLWNNSAENLAGLEKRALDHAGSPQTGKVIRDYWDRVGDAQACTGVAETTARALNRAVGKPGFDFLVHAGTVDRSPNDSFHTATEVGISNGKSYVFDWHATLDIGDPLIFPSREAFKATHPSVRYSQFWGWS